EALFNLRHTRPERFFNVPQLVRESLKTGCQWESEVTCPATHELILNELARSGRFQICPHPTEEGWRPHGGIQGSTRRIEPMFSHRQRVRRRLQRFPDHVALSLQTLEEAGPKFGQ